MTIGVCNFANAREVCVPKKPIRHKHVPQRTCVGCREVNPKRALVRIVRTPQGVQVDLTGKMNGRGAYLHDRRSCWERSLKGALDHAVNSELTLQYLEHLAEYIASLLEETTAQMSNLNERV